MISPRPSPTALLVGGHEWLARSLESVLAAAGYAVLRSYSEDQAVEHVLATSPDLIFIALDHELTGPGLGLCRDLSGLGPPTPPPLILVTPHPFSRAERLEALRAGAWEVLGFPLDAEAMLLHLERIVRLRLDLLRAEDSGLLDPATGLYNVRGMLQRVREEGALARRYRSPLACLVIGPGTTSESGWRDPAGFGDEASPLETASLLRAACREGDIVGRLGPRDFVVLAPVTDLRGGLALARRLTALIEAEMARERRKSGDAVRIGVSAVSDLAAVSIQPVDLLIRAVAALRRSRSAEGAPLIYSH